MCASVLACKCIYSRYWTSPLACVFMCLRKKAYFLRSLQNAPKLSSAVLANKADVLPTPPSAAAAASQSPASTSAASRKKRIVEEEEEEEKAAKAAKEVTTPSSKAGAASNAKAAGASTSASTKGKSTKEFVSAAAAVAATRSSPRKVGTGYDDTHTRHTSYAPHTHTP